MPSSLGLNLHLDGRSSEKYIYAKNKNTVVSVVQNIRLFSVSRQSVPLQKGAREFAIGL